MQFCASTARSNEQAMQASHVEIYLFSRKLTRAAVRSCKFPTGSLGSVKRNRGGLRSNLAAKRWAYLPFEANAHVFAFFLGRKHRQRRSSLRQHALAGFKIKTIAMVVATQLGSVQQLSGGL